MRGGVVSGFTPEELAELAAFDADVDEGQITLEEWLECTARDAELRNDGEKKRKHRKDPSARQRQTGNAERWKAYIRKYREEHREELLLYNRVRYAAKRDEILEQQKKHRAENREDRNAHRRALRAENAGAARERDREYWRANADAINARRRARYQERKKQKEVSAVDAATGHPAA